MTRCLLEACLQNDRRASRGVDLLMRVFVCVCGLGIPGLTRVMQEARASVAWRTAAKFVPGHLGVRGAGLSPSGRQSVFFCPHRARVGKNRALAGCTSKGCTLVGEFSHLCRLSFRCRLDSEALLESRLAPGISLADGRLRCSCLRRVCECSGLGVPVFRAIRSIAP